jgi:hypothetical protein
VIRVCSGWHPQGSRLYGRRFLESFDRFWSKDIELRVYTEEPEQMPRDACRDLWAIPGARDCQAHYAPAQYHGRVPDERWKPSARAAGYNYRFDAAKFWKQLIIPQAASLDMPDGDILIWLDGDVETIAPIEKEQIADWLGDAEVCYLGRAPKHSEIGFWAVRLNAITRKFLRLIALQYTSGRVLQLKESHSAFVWDAVRQSMRMIERDMTPGGRGHVFPQSPVGQHLRHDKGKRKPNGSRG